MTSELRVLDNRSATQRALRLSLLYAVVLAALYAFLAVIARSATGGQSPGATAGLALFGGVAVVVGLLGVGLALSSAPRRIELAGDATVLVGRFGQRRRLPPLGALDVRVVRQYRAGLLSAAPVQQVELTPRTKGRRVTFLVEEGLLEPSHVGGPLPPAAA